MQEYSSNSQNKVRHFDFLSKQKVTKEVCTKWLLSLLYHLQEFRHSWNICFSFYQ